MNELAAKFNKAFEDALPGQAEETHAHYAKMGVAGKIDIGAAQGAFCKYWPKIKGIINMALPLAAYIPGFGTAAVAATQAFITAVDKTLYPMICETAPTP